MKVLLLDDVYKLGWLGDIVEVKDGYARNYLVPYGLATIPTEENIEAIAEEKAQRAQERKVALEKLEKVRDGIEGAEVKVVAAANFQGHLFGSVGAAEIGKALRDAGYEVSDDMVPGGHIKEVGVHNVTLKLAQDLNAQISVEVVAEGQEVDTAEEKAE
ncbi:MAG: 50S ribosomal protein L9 [Sedimentisphaeraceae bacterium JB056]